MLQSNIKKQSKRNFFSLRKSQSIKPRITEMALQNPAGRVQWIKYVHWLSSDWPEMFLQESALVTSFTKPQV